MSLPAQRLLRAHCSLRMSRLRCPLLLLGVAGLSACPVMEKNETGERLPHDTAPELPTLVCNDDYLDAPSDLEDPSRINGFNGLMGRLVEVTTEDFHPLCVAVYFPERAENRLYEAGAPVVVSVVPGLKMQIVAEAQVLPEFGVVEVQPLYASWGVDGCGTSGDTDLGGEGGAAAIRDAIRFATGELTTTDGLTLGQLVGMPLCNERAVVLGSSSGGSVAHQALAYWPEMLAERVAGLGLHETPSSAQFVVQDMGATWMDSDQNVDADTNGVTWDDGRNYTYQVGMCSSFTSCALDYSTLAFAPTTSLDEVYRARYTGTYPKGLLYLDSNGDGEPNHLEFGSPDMNQNGAYDPWEDYFFIPMWDRTWSEEVPMYYSPEVLRAAVELGILEQDRWPERLATLQQSEAFWTPRDMVTHMEAIGAAYQDPFRVTLEFTEIDHGIDLASRPHIWVLNEMFLNEGVNVRLNGALDMLSCSLLPEDLAGWAPQVEPMQRMAETELTPYALPEVVGNRRARGTAVLSVFWDLYGPFDYCPLAAE